MAITQDYVSCVGVEGNDYSGASFIDGAYTSATKTLTKAGAFADTSVGHWLYLESNGGAVATVWPDKETVDSYGVQLAGPTNLG